MQETELFSLITERRTIHRFTDKKIPEVVLEKSLRLATYALNHKHTQPWRFQVIPATQMELREKIFQLALTLKLQTGPLSKVKQQDMQNKYLRPSYLVILLQTKSAETLQTKEDYASIACAVQLMSLYLWQKGVGSKWSTGAITRAAELYECLQVSADELSVEGFFWVGDSEITPDCPPKIDVQQITHWVR